jgi:hypothetical protein
MRLRRNREACNGNCRVGVLAHHERKMVGEYTHPTRIATFSEQVLRSIRPLREEARCFGVPQHDG